MRSLPAAVTPLTSFDDARRTRLIDLFFVAVLIAFVLAALSSVYFGVNTGGGLPEPWTQMAD